MYRQNVGKSFLTPFLNKLTTIKTISSSKKNHSFWLIVSDAKQCPKCLEMLQKKVFIHGFDYYSSVIHLISLASDEQNRPRNRQKWQNEPSTLPERPTFKLFTDLCFTLVKHTSMHLHNTRTTYYLYININSNPMVEETVSAE